MYYIHILSVFFRQHKPGRMPYVTINTNSNIIEFNIIVVEKK